MADAEKPGTGISFTACITENSHADPFPGGVENNAIHGGSAINISELPG